MPRRSFSRPDRRDTGAVAVEFALVLPILLMLVFGAIQYGLYFWSMQGGSSAVRDAARRGAVGQLVTCSEFRNYVKARLGATSTQINLSDIKRTYATASGTPVTSPSAVAAGDVVTVKVKFTGYNFHFPLIPNVNDGFVNEAADARVEYAPTPAPEICA